MKTKSWMTRIAAVVAVSVCALAWSAASRDCPELVGRWPYGPTIAVELSGGYAYTGSGAVLQVVDVSDPSAPEEVGSWETSESALCVEVSGNHVYVGVQREGFYVVDASMPSSPEQVGFVEIPGLTGECKIAVTQRCAVVTAGWDGFRVIDVSTPEAPVEASRVETPEFTIGATVSVRYAYVAETFAGWEIFDISGCAGYQASSRSPRRAVGRRMP